MSEKDRNHFVSTFAATALGVFVGGGVLVFVLLRVLAEVGFK